MTPREAQKSSEDRPSGRALAALTRGAVGRRAQPRPTIHRGRLGYDGPSARDSQKVADDEATSRGRSRSRPLRRCKRSPRQDRGLAARVTTWARIRPGSRSTTTPRVPERVLHSQAGAHSNTARQADHRAPILTTDQGDDRREGETISGQPSMTYGRGAVPGPAQLHPHRVPVRPSVSSTQSQPPFCARPRKLGLKGGEKRRTALSRRNGGGVY